MNAASGGFLYVGFCISLLVVYGVMRLMATKRYAREDRAKKQQASKG
jgi:hypothetical protein